MPETITISVPSDLIKAATPPSVPSALKLKFPKGKYLPRGALQALIKGMRTGEIVPMSLLQDNKSCEVQMRIKAITLKPDGMLIKCDAIIEPNKENDE